MNQSKVSLNTYIVSQISEKHMERKLLNKIEGTYKVGETGEKYKPTFFRL